MLLLAQERHLVRNGRSITHGADVEVEDPFHVEGEVGEEDVVGRDVHQ